MLKLYWFQKILICVICGFVPSQFTVHHTMFCRKTAPLGPGWWPSGRESLCALGHFYGMGLVGGDTLVLECLQWVQTVQTAGLLAENVAFEPYS